VYEAFYGLTEIPFSTSPSPRFAYPSAEHKVAMAKMRYAADQKLGLAVLTGPIGSGKTTTAHQLLQLWTEDTSKKVAFLPSAPEVTRAAFLRSVLSAFDVEPTRNENDNRRFLQAFLVEQFREGKHPLLLIDEGQGVSSRNIDTIADLTNFQTSEEKLITVIMFAQDNLPNKLERKEAFRSRIALYGSLDPLTFEDTCDMIAHRLRVAGGKDLPSYFETPALHIIYNTSKGVPRDVCVLCNTVFVEGFVRSQRPLTCDLVQKTVAEMKRIKKWPIKGIDKPLPESVADDISVQGAKETRATPTAKKAREKAGGA
jgi:general secretion pathway protein A